MTLCLAAECRLGKESRLLIATDYNSENEIIGAEIESKITRIGDKHVALMAGGSSRAMEFVYVCDEYFATDCAAVLDTLDKLKDAVRIYKRRLAGEYVAGKLGLDYDSFLHCGAQK